ncbi:MAG: hypothetical protein JSU63_20535 [Phycisphaerales bacterium]|nr:MAG: hypothetical protein JSU63_20535 [Phycisphaerales bacterium]
MKTKVFVICTLFMAATVVAQPAEVDEDLLSQLWYMEDATPLDTGQFDLRFGFDWVTESGHANLGDSDDDYVMETAFVWGVAENFELSLAWDAWLGDSGDMGPFEDGNYDTTLGMLWRLHKQGNKCAEAGCLRMPNIALSAAVRLPTGCESSGVDGELRLIMTNEYDSGIRSHINVYGLAIDGDNQESVGADWMRADWGGLDDDDGLLDPRDFQWGIVLGADGPLCADGAVRWVADYLHKASEFKGRGDMDIFEFGWEWTMSEMHKVGMSMQVGLDHTDDNPNFGAGLMYALSLGG